MNCLFASDLHGDRQRYTRLFEQMASGRPGAVFLGGDLFPAGYGSTHADFIDFLLRKLEKLRLEMNAEYPRVFTIMGNDDARASEPCLLNLEKAGLIEYIHGKKAALEGYSVYGYACVPPTPFLLKDWERYDLSRYADPGSISPEDGQYSYPVEEGTFKYPTIKTDLERLTSRDELNRAIFLFHAPPYDTLLDRADLDSARFENVPLDIHVGSIAIRRFIETRQPLLTLHGHIHESARLSGSWKDAIGQTRMLTAAHDGPELALVHFSPESLDAAYRELI